VACKLKVLNAFNDTLLPKTKHPKGLVRAAIDACDADIRQEMWGSVVLTGARRGGGLCVREEGGWCK
jgi:hypothetical protein